MALILKRSNLLCSGSLGNRRRFLPQAIRVSFLNEKSAANDFVIFAKANLDLSMMSVVEFSPENNKIVGNSVKKRIQCNLDFVTTCDLVTIFQRPFSFYYIKSFDLVTLCDLSSDSFCGDKNCN